MRAPLVYEAHGIAAESAAARPALLTGAAPASEGKLRRLTARDARVWHAADGYVAITHGLARELERRFGPRPRIAVVPDGAADGSTRLAADHADLEPGASRLEPRTSFIIGYAGHLYPWKGVDTLLHALVALPEARGLIVGGHSAEPDLERVRRLAVELGLTEVFRDDRGRPARSFPAGFPIFRLDRIYVRGFSVYHAEVHHGHPWSKISDHAMLSARLAVS
jgi:glycosyltransferase involved in cell wall biosynthesis